MMCNYFQGITTHNNDSDFVTIDPVEVLPTTSITKPEGEGNAGYAHPRSQYPPQRYCPRCHPFWVAAGLQLVFGVQRIFNLACGSFYARGAYTCSNGGRSSLVGNSRRCITTSTCCALLEGRLQDRGNGFEAQSCLTPLTIQMRKRCTRIRLAVSSQCFGIVTLAYLVPGTVPHTHTRPVAYAWRCPAPGGAARPALPSSPYGVPKSEIPRYGPEGRPSRGH